MTKDVIELRGATKRFRSASGGVHTAVHDLTMTVAPNEFVAVVGPTGCGKSTTLSLVSGLEPASEGEVLVAGEPVRGIPDGVRNRFDTPASSIVGAVPTLASRVGAVGVDIVAGILCAAMLGRRSRGVYIPALLKMSFFAALLSFLFTLGRK